jgi:hypothetical protein
MAYALEHIPASKRHTQSKGHVVDIETSRTLCGIFIHRPAWLSPRKPDLFGDTQRSLITCKRCRSIFIHRATGDTDAPTPSNVSGDSQKGR